MWKEIPKFRPRRSADPAYTREDHLVSRPIQVPVARLPSYLDTPCEESERSLVGVMIMRAKRLTIKQRKEIFLALVGLQDMGGVSNAESMSDIEKQFRIDDAQLIQIIDEGIDKDWLDEPVPAM